MRGLEILQYLCFLVELIFISSSYSVCFPKHLICHKNLIYHMFFCSLKSVCLIQRQIPLTLKVERVIFCVIFISWEHTMMPSILEFCIIASASISIPKTKSIPDKGHPCQTPRARLKKSEAKSLFVTQLVMLQ